jgi:hypothetical protein
MNDYRFTQEYLDRFGLNKGEIYWLNEAVKLYKENAKAELDSIIADGGRPIMTPDFVDHMYDEIMDKLDKWLKPELVYEEDEE